MEQEREREREGERDRQTEIERQTERETERERERWAGRQTERDRVVQIPEVVHAHCTLPAVASQCYIETTVWPRSLPTLTAPQLTS